MSKQYEANNACMEERKTLHSVLSNFKLSLAIKRYPVNSCPCICTFSLEAAFYGCANIYGHFERSAFMEGFLSSYRFMISVILNKTVIAYQSQADYLLSSCNVTGSECVMCEEQGETCMQVRLCV